jgi:hypothetical protein
MQQDINAFLDALLDEAKGIREDREKVWETTLKAFRGNMPATANRPDGLSRAQVNNVWRIAHLVVAQLTDAKPRVEVGSRRPALGKVAAVLKRVVEAIWYLQEVDRKVAMVCYDVLLLGRAFMKVIWDPGLAWGEGDIAILRVDPRYVYTDASPTLATSQYICYRVPVPLWEIRALYPEKGVEVTPDYEESREPSTPPKTPYVVRPGWTKKSAIPKAWLEEWWIRDPSLNDDGTMRYPSGRLIVRAGGNRTILLDVPNPTSDPWPGPWVDVVFARDPDSPWGWPMLLPASRLQDSLDNLVAYLEDTAAILSGGLWIADKDAIDATSLERRDYFTPRPGKIIWKKPGSTVQRDPNAPVPAGLLESARFIYQAQEAVTGLVDVSAPRVPRGMVAGAALEALQSSSQAAVRLAVRELEAALTQVGQWTIHRVLQFYTNKRILHLLGPAGTFESIEFDPSELRTAAGDLPLEELYKQFRFMVSPGSGLALTKERQYALAAALFCVSEDTEILTQGGWKRYSELSVGEKVLAVSPDLRRMAWEPVRAVHVYPYKGPMVDFGSKHLPAIVTPNHRWLVYTDGARGRKHAVRFVETKDLRPGHCLAVRLPWASGNGVEIPDDWLRLLAWTVTEGTYPSNWKGCIYIAQKDRTDDLEKVLRRLGQQARVSVRTARFGVKMYSVRGEAAQWIREEFPDRRLRYDFIASLSGVQAEILLEEMIKGDGSTRGRRVAYFSCDPVLADQVMALAVVAGYGVSANGYPRAKRKRVLPKYGELEYHVTIRKRKASQMSFVLSKARLIPYNGIVWCPETPSGTWIARRAGVTFLTGNSMGAIDQEALLTLIEFPDKDRVIERMTRQAAGMPVRGAGPRPRGRGAAVARRLVGAVTGTPTGGGPTYGV